MISRLESCDYTPSIDQLQSIAEVLNFEVVDLFEDDKAVSSKPVVDKKYNIAVAGTGYVGLSIATLLSHHNHVTAVDIIPEKVDLINNRKSPIQDDYIEMYLAEKDLDLTATLDGEEAYKNADFVVIAAPTNYDSKKNFFDCSAVEAVIELVLKVNPNATMIIKSTIPVGYTASVREKYNTKNIIFSPEFLRESKALYDNLYPSRIIVCHNYFTFHLQVRYVASSANLPHSGKAWFCCETSTVMELVFLPFIYSWWTSTYQRHIASLCQLRNNFFSKISHKAQYYQLTLKISTKKEPLISQKSQTLRFYLYSISPNCTILA